MTTTYATTRIVIDIAGARIWVEDLGHDTSPGITDPFLERVGVFIDRAHVHLFQAWPHFTQWLVDEKVVVSDAFILGAELSDEERKP